MTRHRRTTSVYNYLTCNRKFDQALHEIKLGSYTNEEPQSTALTHNGLPVLTAQRLAAYFGLTAGAIQNYSRQHASQLLENTHYFLLTGETQRLFRLDNRSSPDTPSHSQPSLTVWTEAGALQLAQCISPTFATQAMPTVRRYLYAADPRTARHHAANPGHAVQWQPHAAEHRSPRQHPARGGTTGRLRRPPRRAGRPHRGTRRNRDTRRTGHHPHRRGESPG